RQVAGIGGDPHRGARRRGRPAHPSGRVARAQADPADHGDPAGAPAGSAGAGVTGMPAVPDERRSRPLAHDPRVAGLMGRLPDRVGRAPTRLLQPQRRGLRLTAGSLLICGGFLSILPVFGLWMLPLGLLLIAEDVPPLKSAVLRMLD